MDLINSILTAHEEALGAEALYLNRKSKTTRLLDLARHTELNILLRIANKNNITTLSSMIEKKIKSKFNK